MSCSLWQTELRGLDLFFYSQSHTQSPRIATMLTNTTTKRKRISIDTKVAVINAVEIQKKSILTLTMICKNQRHLPFTKTPHSSLFPMKGITTTPAITKNKSCRYYRVPLYMFLCPFYTPSLSHGTKLIWVSWRKSAKIFWFGGNVFYRY